MRGKDEMKDNVILKSRITPAYAGKSTSVQDRSCEHEDHPRLCGEKHSIYSLFKPHLGSPPPMRGKVVFIFNAIKAVGITPAYAGKSVFYPVGVEAVRDHPRLCGEKILHT